MTTRTHHADIQVHALAFISPHDYRWDTAEATVCFRYTASDPYAITLTTDTPSGPVECCVARKLLAEGMRSPAGEGDARIAPDRHPALVRFSLSTSLGQLRFFAPYARLIDFLVRSYSVVQPGSESLRIDWDTELARLTGGEHR